jgi:transposase
MPKHNVEEAEAAFGRSERECQAGCEDNDALRPDRFAVVRSRGRDEQHHPWCRSRQYGSGVRKRSHQGNDLSPRILRLIMALIDELNMLEARIDALTEEIEALAAEDDACQRLMSVPGIGVIISSAVVSAIGTGGTFKQGTGMASHRPSTFRSS